MSKVNTAPIEWAQRSDSLYITIALSDVKDESINLEDETLKFRGKSEGKEYEVDIIFLNPVDAEGSTYKVLPRSVQMHVMKKDKEVEAEAIPAEADAPKEAAPPAEAPPAEAPAAPEAAKAEATPAEADAPKEAAPPANVPAAPEAAKAEAAPAEADAPKEAAPP